MPRILRAIHDDEFYHVLNRGNARIQIFHDKWDYMKFMEDVKEAKNRYPIDIFAYCVMPNHFHFVIRPNKAEYLAKYMHLLLTKYVRYYHQRYRSSGHIWQGRYKSFWIQNDDHLITILRYVEANPVRAVLVRSAQEWRWSSIHERLHQPRTVLVNGDILDFPENWISYVDTPLSEPELIKARSSVNRQAPFGDDEWTKKVCDTFALNHTRRRGRPQKG